MSTSPQPPLFLSDEAFELLIRRVPNEVLQALPPARFEELIGLSRQRFEEIVAALGANGRTQGLIGHETAGYLRNALGLAILECEDGEFETRTGVGREDAMNLLRQLSFRIDGKAQEGI